MTDKSERQMAEDQAEKDTRLLTQDMKIRCEDIINEYAGDPDMLRKVALVFVETIEEASELIRTVRQ